MSTTSANNKRIAKNTLFLYFRTFIIMLVSLYTSRIVLQQLGVEDFGIYNIIGGVVVLFSVVNGAMVLSTQRFLNYELGRGNIDHARNIFSASVNIHLLIIFIFLLLAETIGLWFVNHCTNIPDGKQQAANWVYHLSVVATAVSIFRAPYNAAIIAYERMVAYAYISIVDVMCKLGIVYLLVFSQNKLVDYAGMIALVTLLVTLFYIFYCLRNFGVCHYVRILNKGIYGSLLGFSWWSLFGSVANMGAGQGLNVVLNLYFGVSVNAAMGIANQVNTAVYQFVSNFQTAFNPLIIKSYAAGEMDYFKTLLLNTSRYSYLLLFFLSLPILFCAPEILQLWLGQVPKHAVSFFRLIMTFMLIDAIQGPLWVSAQATGKIRDYQLLMSFLILLNLPLSMSILYYYRIPELALCVKVGVNLITATARVFYLRRLYHFPSKVYLQEVVLVCIVVSCIASVVPAILSFMVHSFAVRLIVVGLAALLSSASTIYWIGIKAHERSIIRQIVRKLINSIHT